MKNVSWLTEKVAAHRGLHDNIKFPENSLAAYKNAVEHGYNIEMDVWLTDSNVLIMHHDASLKRTAGQDVKATALDTNNLAQYKLFGTEEHVPTFDEMLNTIDGKVNLIIEIKPTHRVQETCEAVMKRLKEYKGTYCLESFDLRVVNYIHKHYPDVILGQLYDHIQIQRYLAALCGQYKKVDFLAINVKDTHWKYYDKIRKNHPEKIFVVWTVRTPEQQLDAKLSCDTYIFETNIKNKDYIELPKPEIE